jgi:hypothetical protein
MSVQAIDYDGLMQANLTRVFGERDATRRLEAIAELYADDAVFYEPPDAAASGHAALAIRSAERSRGGDRNRCRPDRRRPNPDAARLSRSRRRLSRHPHLIRGRGCLLGVCCHGSRRGPFGPLLTMRSECGALATQDEGDGCCDPQRYGACRWGSDISARLHVMSICHSRKNRERFFSAIVECPMEATDYHHRGHKAFATS